MTQPALFETELQVGDVLTRINRTTGRRICKVTVLVVHDDGTYTVGPIRHADTSRTTVTRDLLRGKK